MSSTLSQLDERRRLFICNIDSHSHKRRRVGGWGGWGWGGWGCEGWGWEGEGSGEVVVGRLEDTPNDIIIITITIIVIVIDSMISGVIDSMISGVIEVVEEERGELVVRDDVLESTSSVEEMGGGEEGSHDHGVGRHIAIHYDSDRVVYPVGMEMRRLRGGGGGGWDGEGEGCGERVGTGSVEGDVDVGGVEGE